MKIIICFSRCYDDFAEKVEAILSEAEQDGSHEDLIAEVLRIVLKLTRHEIAVRIGERGRGESKGAGAARAGLRVAAAVLEGVRRRGRLEGEEAAQEPSAPLRANRNRGDASADAPRDESLRRRVRHL